MTIERCSARRGSGFIALASALLGCQASNAGDLGSAANAAAGEQSDPVIVAMFDDYAKSMNEHDLGRSVGLYAPQFILADRGGSRLVANDAQRRKDVENENAYYRDTLGMTSATATVVSQVPMKDHHIFVRTVWHCTFKKTGDRVVDFPLDFVVEKIAPYPPLIILHVVELDEPKVFRDLGLIQ